MSEATSGIGAGEVAVPSATGTAVLLNADPDLQTMLDRVERAGGRILILKTATTMDAGYFAVITDAEGNTMGLHSQEGAARRVQDYSAGGSSSGAVWGRRAAIQKMRSAMASPVPTAM